MSSWDYTNIGASALPEHKELVKQIFKYIGFGEHAAGGDGAYEEQFFSRPDVFCCLYSNWSSISGNIGDSFSDIDAEDMLNLLNALFPPTKVYVRYASGNDTSDSWENTDRVYDPNTMTCYCGYSVTNYDVGPNGKEKWRERIALKPPKPEYVEALIKISRKEKNEELTALLLDLSRRLRDGEIVYADDPTDTRIIGERYDATDHPKAQVRKLSKQYFKLVEEEQHIEFAGKKFFVAYPSECYYHKNDEISKYLDGIITDTLDNTVDYISFGVTDYSSEGDYEDFDELYDSISNAIAITKKNPHIRMISIDNLEREIREALRLRKNAMLSEIIDADAAVVFRERHFTFRELTYEEKHQERIIDQVGKMGGIIHDDPVKKLDYFVIGDEVWCEYPKSVLKILDWREKGSCIKLVTSDMVRKVLNNSELLQEMERRAEEEEKQREEQEALQQAEKERRILEEKLKKQEEKNRAREEREQQRAEQKAKAIEEALYQKKLIAERRQAEIEMEKEQKRREKEAALEEARAKANVLYAPGEEPEKLHNRIQTLLAKLDGAYPDHMISNLGKDHKKWSETITDLYRKLGYADNQSFLEAYGFKVCSENKGGRPTTLDPETVIEELKRRYPDGTDLKMSELIVENKDLQIKTLQNNATELLGMGLGQYLKQIGILKR